MFEEPSAAILPARVCEGGGRSSLWRTYPGTKPETADTDKGTLRRITNPPLLGGATSSPNQPTSYGYDTLDNLTQVTQGVQTRTFTYSSLSRLLSATNPESGTITYDAYDENGNLLSKTDARGIITTYGYDALNRITSRSYSDTTPDVTYTYDSAPNGAGRLASVSTSVSTTSYESYDTLGRVLQSSQTTEGQTYTFNYTYNLADGLTSQTYPSGLAVETEYDGAGRTAGVRRGTGGYYAGAGPLDPNRIQYLAHGAAISRRLGNSLWEYADFNSRLQPTQIRLWDESLASNVVELGYDFGTTTNNGNVLGQTITIEGAQPLSLAQSYTYDSLNRLETASETDSWSQTYGYDRYGNRWVASGAEYGNDPLLTPISSLNFDSATNRLITSVYDAAGNLTTDATSRTFEYDAENRQVAFQNGLTAVEYFYDGEGRRVKKANGTEITVYVYDILGQLAAEYSNSADTETGHKYITADHLGSTRLVTDEGGVVQNRYDYLPFGETIAASLGDRSTVSGYGAPDVVNHKFTGKERDAESGLDYFGARYYGGSFGRFTGADEPLLDQFEDDPQSWHLYSYVRNNPLRFVDPTGRKCVKLDDGTTGDDGEGEICPEVVEGDQEIEENPTVTVVEITPFVPLNPFAVGVFQRVERMAGPPVRFFAGATMGFIGAATVVGGVEALSGGGLIELGIASGPVAAGPVLGTLQRFSDPRFAAHLERQLINDGPGSIFRTLRSLERQLAIHKQDLPRLKHKSAVEREIRTFMRQVETVKRFIIEKGLRR